MKKLLGISMVAILAVSPMMASAADTAPSSNLTAASGEAGLEAGVTGVIIAGAGAYYKGKTITDTDRSTTASAAYVKGAYNDALSAVNKVATDVTVQFGLAQTAATGVKTTIENKLGAGSTGYDINAKTLKVQGKDAVVIDATQTLTNKTINADNNTISNLETDNFKSGVVVTSVGATGTDTALPTEKAVRSAITSAVTGLGMSDYAKKTGVTKTITASSASGQFDIVTDWATENIDHVTVSSTLTGATYTE